LRLFPTACLLFAVLPAFGQSFDRSTVSSLPDAPSQTLLATQALASSRNDRLSESSSVSASTSALLSIEQAASQTSAPPQKPAPRSKVPLDENGNPVPIEMQQPTRILGFMPNFRSVSLGAKAPPPGWKYNFNVAWRQAFDYSSFGFLGLTSISAEWLNEHPSLGKGPDGFYEYTWRGFLDKTDGTLLAAWLLPSLLHEDTRFYALGSHHSIPVRFLYVISRQAIAKDYDGHPTINAAGLGGKVISQYVSRSYYPEGSSDFGVLVEKFGYSVMRDVIFSSIREYYPDIRAHFIRAKRAKQVREAAARP
jgi:hypothetical protein